MIRKEATKGTPITPNTGIPLFNETLTTNPNLEDIDPIVGLKSARYDIIKGQRDHTGELTIPADPNLLGYFLDMLFTKTSTTGSNPYTHVFGLSTTTDPNSYTVDIAKGNVVYRFWGVQAREMGIDFSDNQGRIPVQVSALGCLSVREIATVSTNTITLKTEYDAAPNKGFVASDVVRVAKSDNSTTLDTTVTTVNADGITLVLGASAAAYAAGDFIYLRKQTPTFTLAGYVQWAKTEFRFAATASAALSAVHTPVESGSGWTLKHMMLPDEGSKRSGAYDPVSLIRGLGDAELRTRIFFDHPDDQNRFLATTKRACIVRHFVGATNQFELRVTFNNIVVAENPVNLAANEILYNDLTWRSKPDATDAQHFAVTCINAVATI
jgi:hypothetical protein